MVSGELKQGKEKREHQGGSKSPPYSGWSGKASVKRRCLGRELKEARE